MLSSVSRGAVARSFTCQPNIFQIQQMKCVESMRLQQLAPWFKPCRRGQQHCRHLITQSAPKSRSMMSSLTHSALIGASTVVVGGGILYILYQNDFVQPLPPTKLRSDITSERRKREAKDEGIELEKKQNVQELSALPFSKNEPQAEPTGEDSAWESFTSRFETFSKFTDDLTDIKWAAVSESITDFVVPKWAQGIPDSIAKLKRELSMAPGSLADDIWKEAHDLDINPEIMRPARVRVSAELCDEEKDFLKMRKRMTTVALAKYLGLPQEEVHPEDVPTIAVVGSGGGLRACVAGTGSMLAAGQDGLMDCVTYTAGVSGSCWLQAIYNSSLGQNRFERVVQHLKNRIGVHIAYPPAAFGALNSAPTNKFLLSGFVEKLKGDASAEIGLVDLYGLMLAARLLVPKGELEIEDRDLKISNQRDYIKNGEHPMPIYTAVRHEIPIDEQSSEIEKETGAPSQETKEKARKESWFQWFEITPYEFFCEEFNAGIPTWALGRKFKSGSDVPQDESGFRVPELRLPLLMGIFGSAFCATLSHYYKEIRPIVKGLTGFGSIDELIEGRNDDLKLVHPIEPASIPNFAFGMEGALSPDTPTEIFKNEHIQLMDAGMSNNLPIYPLLRPGRQVDVLIAFDASADIKTENWISVTDGYAKQRGIKGWPVGAGWPPATETAEKTAEQLEEAQAQSAEDAEKKIAEAKEEQGNDSNHSSEDVQASKSHERSHEENGDLGYCTVWVGTTQERENKETDSGRPTSKAGAEDWQLMDADAGIAVIYFPFLSNPKCDGVDPVTSPFMSTWNFIYTPEDVDNVVALAKANYDEGKEKTRRTIRAVYERKKKLREERENSERGERFRRKMRLGIVGKKGEGDHFS